MLKKQTCKSCSKEIRFEFSIKNGIWHKIPKKWQNKTLCIECFLELLEKEAPNQKIELNDFYFLGAIGYPKNFGGILRDKKKQTV